MIIWDWYNTEVYGIGIMLTLCLPYVYLRFTFCTLVIYLMQSILFIIWKGLVMISFLPDAVQQGLEEARKAALKRKDRLSVHDGDDTYRIRRFWDGGFALDLDGSDRLRGHVDIYDGPRHLYQCLVMSSVDADDERVFEFKWLTPVANQPAADFVRPDFVPAGLISR